MKARTVVVTVLLALAHAPIAMGAASNPVIIQGTATKVFGYGSVSGVVVGLHGDCVNAWDRADFSVDNATRVVTYSGTVEIGDDVNCPLEATVSMTTSTAVRQTAKAVESLTRGQTITVDLDFSRKPPAPDVPDATAEATASSEVNLGSQWSGKTEGANERLALAAILAVVVGGLLWLCHLVARAAQRKGRSYAAWFWISIFFLVPAAIVVAIMGPSHVNASGDSQGGPSQRLGEPTKRCPFCGEEILAVAKKCKHCGEFLEEVDTSQA